MCGFIAQLVEHRTGIAEVTGSNPVEALIFFRLLLSNCLSWKINCDDHLSLSLLSGIVEAEREVIKTMETLGMLPLLTSSNILRTGENGEIIYINPGLETNLVDISFEPEENECMTVDELLDLDNDILCSVAEANEQC